MIPKHYLDRGTLMKREKWMCFYGNQIPSSIFQNAKMNLTGSCGQLLHLFGNLLQYWLERFVTELQRFLLQQEAITIQNKLIQLMVQKYFAKGGGKAKHCIPFMKHIYHYLSVLLQLYCICILHIYKLTIRITVGSLAFLYTVLYYFFFYSTEQ